MAKNEPEKDVQSGGQESPPSVGIGKIGGQGNLSSVAPVAARIDAAIQAWVVACIHNSPISQSTESWNHLHGALAQLRDALVAAVKEE